MHLLNWIFTSVIRKFNKSTEIGLAPCYAMGKYSFLCVRLTISMEKRNTIAGAGERTEISVRWNCATTRYMNKYNSLEKIYSDYSQEFNNSARFCFEFYQK